MLQLNGFKKFLKMLNERSNAEVSQLAQIRQAHQTAVNKRNTVEQYARDLALNHSNIPVSLLQNQVNMVSTLQRTAKQLDVNIDELQSQESQRLEAVRSAKQAEQSVENTIQNKIAAENAKQVKQSTKNADELAMSQYNLRAKNNPGFFANQRSDADSSKGNQQDANADLTTKTLAAMFLNLKNSNSVDDNQKNTSPIFDETAPLRVR